jgi:hypothetical protein
MAKISNPSVVHGKHRSLALAERHRRALGKNWRISSRRNAKGKLSSRGHYFTFTRKRPKKKKRKEYHVNVEYTALAKNNPEIQISAIGPSGRSRSQVIKAVEYFLDIGESPRGWDIHVVEWKKAGKTYKGDDSEGSRLSIKSILADPQSKTKVSN